MSTARRARAARRSPSSTFASQASRPASGSLPRRMRRRRHLLRPGRRHQKPHGSLPAQRSLRDVRPQLIPPLHGHRIPELLVCQLMGDNAGNVGQVTPAPVGNYGKKVAAQIEARQGGGWLLAVEYVEPGSGDDELRRAQVQLEKGRLSTALPRRGHSDEDSKLTNGISKSYKSFVNLVEWQS
ncbi:hypothetical protein H2204_011985 [Knufia peltigerae]|uniref:Uncharacterized protein n=1 Tax=Knufia peltigerae TaxID=1002370 RepID=A0AA38XT69_9EURO|nr:hypothetical protein H2204_011985 [Knufia peltigerae]